MDTYVTTSCGTHWDPEGAVSACGIVLTCHGCKQCGDNHRKGALMDATMASGARSHSISGASERITEAMCRLRLKSLVMGLESTKGDNTIGRVGSPRSASLPLRTRPIVDQPMVSEAITGTQAWCAMVCEACGSVAILLVARRLGGVTKTLSAGDALGTCGAGAKLTRPS